MQIPVSRTGDRETMSEHEEEDSEEEDGYDHHSGRPGRSSYEGASGGTGPGRHQDRERSSSSRRDHSASRERSVSPRSERRSQVSSGPARPAKVTLVKSRKNEGEKRFPERRENEISLDYIYKDECILIEIVFMYSESRVWFAVGQPHLCEGHLP